MKAVLKAEKDAEDDHTQRMLSHSNTTNSATPKSEKSVELASSKDVTGEPALDVIFKKVASAVHELKLADEDFENSKTTRVSMDFKVDSSVLDGVFALAGNKEKFAEKLLRTISDVTDESNASTLIGACDPAPALNKPDASVDMTAVTIADDGSDGGEGTDGHRDGESML